MRTPAPIRDGPKVVRCKGEKWCERLVSNWSRDFPYCGAHSSYRARKRKE